MTIQSMIHRGALAALLCTLLAACAGNEVVRQDAPPPSVTSVAEADRQLVAVAHERAGIEARYIERERVCYDKFFVTRCLDEAKEHRRTALSSQRAIEVQAQRFKRQALVDERDRQLAEAEKRYEAQEAKLAAEPPKPTAAPKPEAAPRQSTVPARTAERNARLKAERDKEAADAGKRAANVQALEARKAESARRQQRVAERAAERAAKAAKDAAAAKAKAEQDAARAQQPR